MSPPELRQFISEFSGWLENHALPCLQGGDAIVLENWRGELAAAESLLEQKPELPIAFLGPSQQGKSSLINALLGENILAVGGSVSACTCVITSAHYRPSPHHRAEKASLITSSRTRAAIRSSHRNYASNFCRAGLPATIHTINNRRTQGRLNYISYA